MDVTGMLGNRKVVSVNRGHGRDCHVILFPGDMQLNLYIEMNFNDRAAVEFQTDLGAAFKITLKSPQGSWNQVGEENQKTWKRKVQSIGSRMQHLRAIRARRAHFLGLEGCGASPRWEGVLI